MGSASHITGRNVSFRLLDTAGASFGMTGHGNDARLTQTADTVEATTYGDADRTNLPTFGTYNVEYSGYWSGGGADSAACKLHGLVGSSGTWFQLSPAGSDAGDNNTCPNYSGCVNLTNVDVGMPGEGMVTWAMTLTPRSGSLTLTTGSWTAIT